MELDVSLTSKMMESVFEKANSAVKTEDTCLTIAGSGYYDDVIYCTVFKVNVGGTHYNMCRIFQSGAFQGYFEKVGEEHICKYLKIDSLLPYHVYTQADVTSDKNRNLQQYQNRRVQSKSWRP